MIIDEAEFSLVKTLIKEVKTSIESKVGLLITPDSIKDHSRMAYLSGEINALKELIIQIEELEQKITKQDEDN